MMMTQSVLLCLLLVGQYLPSSVLAGCKRDDPALNECVVKALNSLSPKLVKEEKEHSLPVLDPFEITKLTLSDKTGQGLDLTLEFTDVKIEGLKNLVYDEQTKFDLENHKLMIKLFLPVLTLEGKYMADGKLLLLPIKGSGDANITLGGDRVEFDTDFILETKNGKEYMKLVNSKLDFTIKGLFISLSDLFNGDKTLGDNMNAFLNENWQDVFSTFKPVLLSTFKQIIITVANNVIATYPYDELFPK